MPLGKAALGNWNHSACVVVEVEFGSARLVGRQGTSRKNDMRAQFAKLLSDISEGLNTDVAILYIWCHGLLAKEGVSVIAEIDVVRVEIDEVCQNLQENVRYILRTDSDN